MLKKYFLKIITLANSLFQSDKVLKVLRNRKDPARDAWMLWILCCCSCALKKRVKEAESLCSQLSLSFSCSFALSCLPKLHCKEAQGWWRWWRSLTLFIGTDLELITPRWALLLPLFIY